MRVRFDAMGVRVDLSLPLSPINKAFAVFGIIIAPFIAWNSREEKKDASKN
jgi:hypothetical protein